jgi:uncharacterized protein YjiS (DUF1127 family)
LVCSVANTHIEQRKIRSKLMSVRTLPEPTSAGRSAGDAVLLEIRAPALSSCLSTVAAWIVSSRGRRALRELAEDRRQLSDVGLTREQVLREAAKPFWRR